MIPFYRSHLMIKPKVAKQQMPNLCLYNFKKCFIEVISRIQDLRLNSVDLDEAAHYELPHLDLRCFENSTFFFLLLKCLDILRHFKDLAFS